MSDGILIKRAKGVSAEIVEIMQSITRLLDDKSDDGEEEAALYDTVSALLRVRAELLAAQRDAVERRREMAEDCDEVSS